jgi:hypothetical protein
LHSAVGARVAKPSGMVEGYAGSKPAIQPSATLRYEVGTLR